MIEYYICGTDRTGKVYPREHGMGTQCVQYVINMYRIKYPDVCHVNVDIALDQTYVSGELQ